MITVLWLSPAMLPAFEWFAEDGHPMTPTKNGSYVTSPRDYPGQLTQACHPTDIDGADGGIAVASQASTVTAGDTRCLAASMPSLPHHVTSPWTNEYDIDEWPHINYADLNTDEDDD